MKSQMTIRERWNAYWFREDEYLLLSFYRILLGAAILVEATRYLLHMDGIIDNVIPIASTPPPPLTHETVDLFVAFAPYNLYLLFGTALFFSLGLLSNVVVIPLAFALRLNMYYMAPFADASTTLCYVNLLFMCLVDNSRYLSLDRYLFRTSDSWYRRRLPSGMIKRLMQWHFILIFVSSGVHKASNPDWLNGTLATLLFSKATWSRGTFINEIVQSNAIIGVLVGHLVIVFEICFLFASRK